MNLPTTHWHLLTVLLAFSTNNEAYAALSHSDEQKYLANFDAMQAATYAVADEDLPTEMNVCKINSFPPTRQVTVQAPNGAVINSSTVSAQCGDDSICTIPFGVSLQVDTSLNLGALIVKGTIEWNDDTQVNSSAFVCAGYIAVEGQGKWEMDIQVKDAYIYIKDNGAVHAKLRSRAFGTWAETVSDYPMIDITGRDLTRTWSLLSVPIQSGDTMIKLMHNAELMGWRVGDRIAIAPTEKRATGSGEEFTIIDIINGDVLLNKAVQYDHDASFVRPQPNGNVPALLSAEVINLSRNIVITGDDFKHVGCSNDLPEAVVGEQTSVLGCKCSSFRSQCTLGLHTAIMGGSARISGTRVERCGQRGIEGKYCLHLHKLHDCPTCLFKNNAIEGSHQRGIIVHSTHSSTVEGNVLYNVRGAGVYLEDGNEMENEIKFNVVVCPFPFSDNVLHGCTVPGTSGRSSDTSDNQSGFFTRAATNNLIGNRSANNFNGMWLKAGGIGRGSSYDKVCESAARLGRYEGNTFHGNGRFGTYTLGFNYGKSTDQSILTDGHNIDKSLCAGFDSDGLSRGVTSSIVDNVDYNNAFVGHYSAGDIQYNGHHSYGNVNNLYWKETVEAANGCSAHLTGGSYSRGTLALPDQATFLIENTVFGQGTSLEAAHHCNVGTTGVLCFPTYMLHNVKWLNTDVYNGGMKWVWFQWQKLQSHGANQNDGGVFTLAPQDAQQAINGELEHSIFPPGYVSLVSSRFTYLLSLPGQPCILSTEYGDLYDGGILCKVPLRSLKIYTRGLFPNNAPNLVVEIWYNRPQIGDPDSSQIIGFHQTGSSGPKQGYSLPVIPSAEHSYRLSVAVDSRDVVVEFSDLIVGNRFGIEYIHLSLNGESCGNNGLVSSHHDRRFIWSGDMLLAEEAWGNTGACSADKPPDFPKVDCTSINDGVLNDLSSTESSDLCNAGRCGDHGHCTATYLGGDLPVTSQACICDEGWSGSLCQYNPCETMGLICEHGKCIATSDNDATCLCDDGFTGDNCDESCDGFCQGDWPYNCARNVEDIVKYGCFSSGGCYYLREGEDYPYGGFCTYKEAPEEECMCGSENECELSVSCNPDGSCPSPQYLSDSTPCNELPFGVCQSGRCVSDSIVRNRTHTPTSQPSTPPSSPPLATSQPTNQPTASPSANQGGYCGCASCTQQVWDTMVTDNDGTYSCGGRITWLQSAQSYSEESACSKVEAEFPDLCTCNPWTCDTPTPVPTALPTSAPSEKPTLIPTAEPTKMPTRAPSQSPSRAPSLRPITSSPTRQPSSSPSTRPTSQPTMSLPTKIPTPSPSSTVSSYCGCSTCTDTIWNTPVTDGAGTYTCGNRITYLQSDLGKSEFDSCKRVSEEFPSDQCGPACNPSLCNNILEDPDPSKLIWSDEFNVDGAPDPTKWDYDLEDGCQIGLCNWGNGEVAYYTKSPNNVNIVNGTLRISAKKESGFSLPYTSARMVTRGLNSFKYGRIQFRASIANCQARGTWPALWMLPEYKVYGGWPSSGEVDVMEAVGHEEDLFFGTVHTAAYNGMAGTQKGSAISKSKDDFHTFEVDWKEDRIQFAVDGQIYFEYTRGDTFDVWPFDQEFHLIMNVAVGGAWGGAQGINEASFDGDGQVMEVDWVRVYGDATPQPTNQPTASPSSSNQGNYCGCASCTQQVWDTMVTDDDGTYSCGGRITWLQSAQSYSEESACAKVESEFDLCKCNPWTCDTPTPVPSIAPSKEPTARPVLTFCGCASCTQQVWDTVATDSDGSYTCGGRITWLQNTQGYSEAGACEMVSDEFPSLCPCNPTSCNLFD